MRVLKRNGNYEDVSFDKILTRLKSLSHGEEFSNKLSIDETVVAQKVVNEIYDGVKTTELDELSSQIAISLYSVNKEYKILAGRIVISNHHKNTKNTFTEKIVIMYNNYKNGVHKPLVNKDFYDLVLKNTAKIEENIDYSFDYNYDFFGFKTLEKNYLYKIDKDIIERPQDMLMRVSLAIHRDDIESAMNNYHLMAKHYFTHATPTLYNAGSLREQFASCFLLTMKEDSISGIYDTLKDCSLISKYAGGIGLSIHDIRAKDSHIAGTNGTSNGLVPMLRVFNDTARYVDQGGGKRNGSFAMYLEPWHSDIFEFIELRKNHGNELERARDLFYALWIPDKFMECMQKNDDWYLMCPHESPGLSDVYGDEFNELYNKYVTEGKYRKKIKAQELWRAIITSQIEVGTPYILYKDKCNQKSNQNNLGTIKSSNLCTEIIQYTSPSESAVCNLGSISLKKFIDHVDTSGMKFNVYTKPDCTYCKLAKGLLNKKNIEYSEIDYKNLSYEKGTTFPQIYLIENDNDSKYIGGYDDLVVYLKPTYNYDKLGKIVKNLTRNLNNIIDNNYYPIPETKTSNLKHRPIGIGVQGLANVFFEFGIGFDSDEAKKINENIFETIYYYALEASCELAKEREYYMMRYKSWLSQTVGPSVEKDDFVSSDEYSIIKKYLNHILPEEYNREEYLGSYSSYIGSPIYHNTFQFDMWNYNITDIRHNWTELRNNIKKYGIRNSLLVAPMPTASTAQILGNYECFEPVMSNIYTRRVLSGEFMVINEYLMDDLKSLNLWNSKMKDTIIVNEGSIQQIQEIPNKLKNIYKTVWEIKQRDIIDMAATRGKYICQSQSMNLFLESPSLSTISSMHLYSWKKGLKTGMYYLRTRPSSKAIQFTVAPEACENCSG